MYEVILMAYKYMVVSVTVYHNTQMKQSAQSWITTFVSKKLLKIIAITWLLICLLMSY